jgi:uncharacterized protein
MSRIVPAMKLNEHVPPGINLIRAYAADGVTVGSERLTRPCVVAPAALIRDFTDRDVADLEVSSLDCLWPLAPQVVLLGTGLRQRFAPAPIRSAFAQRRIALEAMDLGAACRTYNVLAQEDRAVVALLFPEPGAAA